jgi:hypothetical protein
MQKLVLLLEQLRPEVVLALASIVGAAWGGVYWYGLVSFE